MTPSARSPAPPPDGSPPVRVWTVGHGTLPAGDFLALLHRAGLRAIVDVRRYPGSRRHPHFASQQMQRWLPEGGIAYGWAPELGGRRRLPADSPDVALRSASFRAYAAHMRSEGFRAAIDELVDEAAAGPTAILCSESLWWRCHRRLISDHLELLGLASVTHLLHDGRTAEHLPTAGVMRHGDELVYDDPAERPLPGM